MEFSKQKQIANDILGYPGTLISWSKGRYNFYNPENLVVFNSNVCTKEGVIWNGDIDLTLNSNKLEELSFQLETEVYVLYEMDGRFENAETPRLDQAVATYKGHTIKLYDSEGLYLDKSGAPKVVKTVRTDDDDLDRLLAMKPTVPYERSNFEASVFKLPNISNLRGIRSKTPLDKFEEYFIKTLGKEEAIRVFHNLYITPEYYVKFKNHMKKYLEKQGYDEYSVYKNVGMLGFYMPAVFYGGCTWADESTGYVKITKESNA